MTNLKKEFFCFLLLIILEFISNIIIIPFNTYNSFISKDQKILNLIKNANDIDIIDTLSKNLVYTNLNIGKQNNNYNIQAFITMSSCEFYIKNLDLNNNTYPEDITGYQNYTYNDNYILKNIFKLNYYNSSLSKTYNFVSDIKEDFYTQLYSFDKGLYANEIFSFQSKNKISDKGVIKSLNLTFTYRQSVRFDHRPGQIGLLIGDSELLYELKHENEINNYEFTIKYTDINEEKGELIIGDPPHVYDENNFKEKDIRCAKAVKDYYLQWNLIFSNIYVENSNYIFKKKEIGTFKIEEFFFLGTTEYFEVIQNIFFNKYINEKICFLQMHKKHPYIDEYYHFICKINDNKKREEFFNNFPSLIFFQKEMYYNFTFNAKDLFTIIPDDNRILFNIEFKNKNKKWEFGKSFFKKYQLSFDLDSKLIKFYINSNNENQKENNNISDIKILIIIMLIIFVFIIGILFGKVLCSKYNRKIRAYELEDNYSYIPKKIYDKTDMKDMDSKDEMMINDDKMENKLGTKDN